MESTRRLSLTLLLVTPIITARKLSSEDLGLGGPSAEWGRLSEPVGDWESSKEPVGDWDSSKEPVGDWDSSTEPKDTYDPEVYDEGAYSDVGSWLRQKRALDSPGDDLETAEQVLFRPTFRYKHLVKEREHRRKVQEELRRQFSQNSPLPAPSSPAVASLPPSTPSVQRKYYNTYPQQNQRVYPPQVPTAQRVYSPQSSPSQRVYSPQSSPSQRVSPQLAPSYQRVVQNPAQYPITPLFNQNNQGFRPQRSPYAYLYPQRVN